MKEGIILYTGTTLRQARRDCELKFPALTWWSRDEETIRHYFEGAVVQLAILLDTDEAQEYLEDSHNIPEGYTYGVADMETPKAKWYSISSDYIKKNYMSVAIFDDVDEVIDELKYFKSLREDEVI